MKLNLKEKNNYLRSLNVHVQWDELKDEYHKEYLKIKKNYNLQGFRKGKVPDHIVKKNLEGSIVSNFIEHGINIFYKKALEELKINPINQGNITKVEDFKENGDLKFVVEFEVLSDIKLPAYQKKINISTKKYIANDVDVNEAIEKLRNQYASAKTVEGNIKNGNFIYADFTKLNDSNEPIEDSVLKNHYVRIGEGIFTGNLGKSFINKKAGEVLDVAIEQDSGLINYRVKINKIEEQILPEINDDFAKSIDKNVSDVKVFKENIKNNIQNNLNNENIKELHQRIIDYFLDKTKFDPPASMVDNYKKHLVDQYKKQSEGKGEAFDEEKYSQETEIAAQKMVKWQLIRQKIIKDENIAIPPSDIDKHIKDIMNKNPNQKKDILKYYEDSNNKNQLYQDMMEKKLFDSLNQFFINKIKEESTDTIRKKGKKNDKN